MREMNLGNGILIDDAEEVIGRLSEKTGRRITDLYAMKKFILNEKNTAYYMDACGGSRLEQFRDACCLWLDTGYLNGNGAPLFISLRVNAGGFNGHIVGTAEELSGRLSGNPKKIRSNIRSFKEKYNEKIKGRRFDHIRDENAFLSGQGGNDEDVHETEISRLLKGLYFQPEEVSEDVTSAPESIPQAENITDTGRVAENADIVSIAGYSAAREDSLPEFPEEYNSITIGLLWDKLEEMSAFNRELQEMIKNLHLEKEGMQDKIDYIEEKNRSLEESFTRMRTFMQDEDAAERARNSESFRDDMAGHCLLGKHGKILVIGDIMADVGDLRGIANNVYGFMNDEIDFETDYSKIKNFGRNLNRSNRYRAVLFGPLPHKMKEMGDVSGIIAKFKSENYGIYAADARSKSGKLKMTKESFRGAMDGLMRHLQGA